MSTTIDDIQVGSFVIVTRDGKSELAISLRNSKLSSGAELRYPFIVAIPSGNSFRQRMFARSEIEPYDVMLHGEKFPTNVDD